MASTVREKIEEAAIAGVKKAQGDQGMVEAMPIADQIEAAKFLGANDVKRNPFKAMKRAVAVPPSLGNYR